MAYKKRKSGLLVPDRRSLITGAAALMAYGYMRPAWARLAVTNLLYGRTAVQAFAGSVSLWDFHGTRQDVGNGADFCYRTVYKTAVYLVSQGGDKIRATFGPSPVAGNNGTCVTVWIGHRASNADFDGNQVQLTFNGNAQLNLVGGGTDVVSDIANFDFDPATDLMISLGLTVHYGVRSSDAPDANYEQWTKSSASGEAGDTTVTGYSGPGAGFFDYATKIEIA